MTALSRTKHAQRLNTDASTALCSGVCTQPAQAPLRQGKGVHACACASMHG
jgi:hypothetical protein